MPEVVGLSEYACDSCRARKLKCSREEPKCTNCAMWSGPCVYSRHGPVTRQPRGSKKLNTLRTNSPTSASPSSYSVETRLSNIEESLSRLTFAVQTLTDSVNAPARSAAAIQETSSKHSDTDSLNQDITTTQTLHEAVIEDEAGTPFYIGNSSASSFLVHAPKDLDQLKGISKLQKGSLTAESGLKDLSEAYMAMGFKDDVRKELRNRRRDRELFYVPDQSEGLQLMRKFSDIISMGDPFFSTPSPDLLPKIVFEPWTLSERGWVIIFNCLLAAAIPPNDPFAKGLNIRLRWNTWLSLEDSCVFLEPSEIKIQALVLVACHGQDFATPSLSWTLISHACRMAQALGLHIHTPGRVSERIVLEHKICLFWSLFMLDKSLSLAFGRPPFLPVSLYEGVPVPEMDLLAKFKPHSSREEIVNTQENKENDTFGALYVLQSLKLSKIMGSISDGLQTGNGTSVEANKADKFIAARKEELESWMRETFEVLPKHGDNPIRNPAERREINIGLNFLRFQYHHLMVLLTRTHAPSKQVCLESSRDALSLLKHLVSSSEQVYNGIVWQLLYYPFTPFFALLGHIISDPHSPDSHLDLSLLRLALSYFGEMDKIYQDAYRLKNVAETFCQLADAYISRARNNNGQRALASQPEETAESDNLIGDFPDAQGNATAASKASPAFVPIKPLPPFTVSGERETVDLNNLPADPAQLLDLLSFPSPTLPPADPSAQANMPVDMELDMGYQVNEQFTSSDIGLMHSLHSKVLDRPMEGTFDWFSWDMYNQDHPDVSGYT